MEYRRLGHSGLWVSEIALGTLWSTDPAPCVRAAFDEGVTTFQTVAADEGADEALGAAIDGLPRDELVLCGGLVPRPAPGGWGRKRVTAAVLGTLRRLGTDHLDVLVLPRHDPGTPYEETFGALADLVARGVLHHVAVCEWTAEQIAASAPLAAQLRVPLVADLAHYSMLWRPAESQVVPAAVRAGLGVLAYAPLAQGLLTGKYSGRAVPSGSRAARGAGTVGHLLQDALVSRVELLGGVASAAGLTMSQLALAWTLQNPSVAGVLVGASSPEQVRENCAASGRALDLDTLTRIDALLGEAIQSDPRLAVPAPTVGLAARVSGSGPPPTRPCS